MHIHFYFYYHLHALAFFVNLYYRLAYNVQQPVYQRIVTRSVRGCQTGRSVIPNGSFYISKRPVLSFRWLPHRPQTHFCNVILPFVITSVSCKSIFDIKYWQFYSHHLPPIMFQNIHNYSFAVWNIICTFVAAIICGKLTLSTTILTVHSWTTKAEIAFHYIAGRFTRCYNAVA